MAKGGEKPKKPLTGLAAALVKAGALNEKDARNTLREQRREDKALGRDGVAARRREQERAAREARARAAHTVAEHVHPGGGGGPRRWYFVTREGRVPFLEVSDECGRMLLDGKAGIVEACGRPGADHVVVAGEKHLVTLIGIDKELVRFWNRGSGPG